MTTFQQVSKITTVSVKVKMQSKMESSRVSRRLSKVSKFWSVDLN